MASRTVVAMRRSDWLLVFLAADSGKPLDPVRVQKGMFLLAMTGELPPDERYAFEPYAYGPMSRQLYRDVRSLCRNGMVVAMPVEGTSWDLLQPTAAGVDRSRDFRDRLQPTRRAAVAEVDAIRRHIAGLSFSELLRYVYDRHPAYAVRSVFRGAS